MPMTSNEEKRGVIRMDDGRQSSLYLVRGLREALLVDTGMAPEPLTPFLRMETELPVTLLVTHGHGDHAAHADEFERAYMSPEDIPLLPGAFRRLGIGSRIRTERIRPLTDGLVVELDGFRVHCINAGGHTPGSMVFYEEKRSILFTGDAVGSGAGVWMQLAGCLPLSRYRENLKKLDAFMAGLPKDTLVYPGHYGQRFMHPSGDNPVCRELVRDMIELCGRILEGREERKPAPEFAVREISPAYTAEYGRASMIYTEQVIC